MTTYMKDTEKFTSFGIQKEKQKTELLYDNTVHG